MAKKKPTIDQLLRWCKANPDAVAAMQAEADEPEAVEAHEAEGGEA